MKIKKIKLENIRSYTNQELNFPEGSTLLAGDIGSGKSTILLAIDFALFGLRKGNLSGASLLRNGADTGLVELHFELDDKDVIIQRNLKRNHDYIVQDAGYIIINGDRRDASATELKQDILNLLNYPKELLTKSKSLIYKYTVYTPQEEMKHILLGDKDIRLDTLRKVFDIDKYKRIKENSKIFIISLKEKKKNYEGQVYDLDDKKYLLKKELNELEYNNLKLKELLPKITEINKLVDNKRNEIKSMEKDIKILDELKKDLSLNELKLKNLIDKQDTNLKEIENLVLGINKLEEELKKFKLEGLENINEQIDKVNDELNKYEGDLNELNKIINEFETKRESAIEIKNKIYDLEKCPLCKQDVPHSHKSIIIQEQDFNIAKYDRELLMSKDKKSSLQKTIKDLKIKLDRLKDEKSKLNLYELKKENLNEKISRKDLLLKEQARLKEEIIYYNDKGKQIITRISEFPKLDYDKVKYELEELLNKEKKLEIERATLLVNIQEINKNILKLEEEIKSKLLVKEKITRMNDIQFWIENYFVNIVELIEKQIMLRVHSDFNSLFQKWFNMLMEIENFTVKLDEEFTPLIQQNGHDINYEYLSGGEKTAIALAYRLALNQVINNIITNIKTKDILILDEPTDGFSDEQLDRVRNVLSELNLKQLIIVSHEQKIESFVDNVIRLGKEQHVTKII